ncbi:MAG: ABC transporter permease [Chloroflexi bacterium]|nr:ABC transporter permease [Chloroflexota bacterium]
MRKILEVARHEFIVSLKRPSFIIATLALPLLGIVGLIVSAYFGGQAGEFLEQQFVGTPKAVGYVDQVGLFTPPLPEYADLFIPYPNEEAGREALFAEEIEALLLIPGDYLDTGRVIGYSKGRGLPTAISVSEERIRPFLVDHLLAGQVDEGLRARVRAPMNLLPVSLAPQGEGSEDIASFVANIAIPYAFSILLVMAIFTSSGFLLQGVSEEKESRVIEILLSSLTPIELLAGKILGLGALGLAQILFWLGCGWALIGIAVTGLALFGAITLDVATIVLALVYFLLGYLLFATLMASAGSLGTSAREGQQIAGIFSGLTAIPFMVSSFIWTNPNSLLVQILSYVPLTSPVMMLQRLGMTEVPLYQIALSLILLILGIGGALWAGAKVFRMGLLMYGKRPSVAEIWRALRQA